MNLTKTTFTTTAQPLTVAIAGQTLAAAPKQFSTGSVGFFLNGKIEVKLADGTPVKLQISASLTAIGSKEWKD